MMVDVLVGVADFVHTLGVSRARLRGIYAREDTGLSHVRDMATEMSQESLTEA